eukprot:4478936-Prymnesium_polylepis.1
MQHDRAALRHKRAPRVHSGQPHPSPPLLAASPTVGGPSARAGPPLPRRLYCSPPVTALAAADLAALAALAALVAIAAIAASAALAPLHERLAVLLGLELI